MDYRIVQIQGHKELTERLKELGLSQGQFLKIHHLMPFKGPQVIQTSQGLLSLRQDEFACLQLEPVK